MIRQNSLRITICEKLKDKKVGNSEAEQCVQYLYDAGVDMEDVFSALEESELKPYLNNIGINEVNFGNRSTTLQTKLVLIHNEIRKKNLASIASETTNIKLGELDLPQVEVLLDHLYMSKYKHMFVEKSMSGMHLENVETNEDLQGLGINLPTVIWKTLHQHLETYKQGGVPQSILQRKYLSVASSTSALSNLTVRQVGALLDHLGLGEYKKGFARESMSGIHLQHIKTKQDLEELKIMLPTIKWSTFESKLSDYKQNGVPLSIFESLESELDDGIRSTDAKQRSLHGALCIMFAAPLVDAT